MRPQRGDEQRVSWRLALLTCVAAVLLGASATVVAVAGRPPLPSVGSAVRVASEPIASVLRDGAVLILQPQGNRPVGVRRGQVLELAVGDQQTVRSSNPHVLRASARPPCHLQAMCFVPGFQFLAFTAEAPGFAALSVEGPACRGCSPNRSQLVLVAGSVHTVLPGVR